MHTTRPRTILSLVLLAATLAAARAEPQISLIDSLDFGSMAQDAPAMLDLQVANSGGPENLIVSALEIIGTHAANFSVSAIPPPVTPEAPAMLVVSFDPMGAEGRFSAQLNITSDDPALPVANVTLAAAVAFSDLDSHLASHFTFDSPAALGDDSAIFDHDGTPLGDAAHTPDARAGDGALLLDGDGDLILVPGGADYTALDDDGDGFTVAAWICPDATATGQMRIFSTYMSAGFSRQGWGVGMRSGGAGAPLLATTYGIIDFEQLGSTPVFGEWHHLTYVYRNSPNDTVEFYVDGILAGAPTLNTGLINATLDFNIGSIGIPGNEQEFFGKIDDLRIYNTELSEIDIAQVIAAAETQDLRILSVTYDGAAISITFSSAPSRTYLIQRSTTLQVWEELDDSFPAAAGEITTFIDLTPPAGGRVYYRVASSSG